MGRVSASSMLMPGVARRCAGVGAVASIIDDGVDGLHYDYPDANSLAQAICALLTQPDSAARMGQAGLAKVRAQYTWDQVVGQIRALLSKVVHQQQVH